MPSDRGFTLLEVLVAFVIAAASLKVLYEGTFSGLRATEIAVRAEEATSLARSRLATIGHDMVLVVGEHSGGDGLYFWHTRIAPIAVVSVVPGDAVTVVGGPHAALYSVTVWISWQEYGARTIRLDSEAVGLAPPTAP